jgi:hypothetical protein
VLASAALGLVLALTTAAPADAGNRGQHGSHGAQPTGSKARPQGDHTRHTEVRRTENGRTRTDTWSGQRGTSTRQADVSTDRDSQTRTRDVIWTGPNGQQGTRTDVTQRTDSGYTRNTTATGPRGGTTTRDVTAVRDPASDTWTKDVIVDRTPPQDEGG